MARYVFSVIVEMIANKIDTYSFPWQCFARSAFLTPSYLFLTAFVSVFPQMYIINRRKVEIRLLKRGLGMQRRKQSNPNHHPKQCFFFTIQIIY